ncbi:ribonuclease Z, mitochondrial isoform X2 [Maniola jurtina]|uniref:ribonuclease Z, mitochondrial isoform X2 n=1 Tax=Maniola jurtina TaxID=191418 RepID=UPI001E68831C|nr:ribonuclease Z, mitochondrial isoform X2 [Maniola jurtina]
MYGKLSLISRVVRIHSVRYYKKDTKKLLEFLASMPKPNSDRIAEAQRQRQTISKKSEKYGPSTVYLQVLGSGARGAPNTLYLFTDQKRYLFNCGEGTQRLAHEHKVKLSRLDDIFITNKTWRNIGGLPGLSLTLQDVGVPNITLHGPEGLDELYNATKRFVIMKDMNVKMAKCSSSEDFKDNVMTVKYVLMGPQGSILQTDPKPAAKKPKLDDKIPVEFEEFIHDDTDYYKSRQATANSKNTNFKPNAKLHSNEKDHYKKKTEKVLEDLLNPHYSTVAYICTIKKRLGTLDLEKCVEFGVKPGPMLGQLKSGHDVVLPDGRLVLSKDVKTPDDPGPVFIVLEVPELSYLNELEFAAHFDSDSNPPENIPTVVVHYTPPHVLQHPKYRAFMAKFGTSTRHLILNSQNSCLGSEAVHRTQHKLHLLDADMFPMLRDLSVPALWTPSPSLPQTDSPIRLKGLEELKNKIAAAQFQNLISAEGSCGGDAGVCAADSLAKLELIAGRTLTMFHLRPKKQLDRSAEPKLHIQDYLQEAMNADGFVESLEKFRSLVDSMRYANSGAQKEYPKVVFLGTGSCIPSKTRNTSAIVVQVDENRSILLDCGEGTFGQLVRFYGPKRVNTFLRSLRAIYVSHLHADHHIGLIGVLQARRQAFEESKEQTPITPLYLLAPGQIVTWLSIYDHQFEPIREEFTLIPNQSLLDSNNESSNAELTSSVLASIGVQEIRTCLVAHCPNAFGVAIQVDHDYKLTYSGDTIPCEELVRIGKDSTLLIHEATMEDELADEARIKMHSTTSQAIAIGKQMGAKYTVLTHFSQRYARLPRLNSHILNDNNSVGIAFDNMQITTSDLELLPHMYAPLQLMFAEHCVELELKAQNRARQKKRAISPSMPTSAPWRQRSPSCHGTASAPAATSVCGYRESKSSRLRQEKSLAERRAGCRSKSCSRSKASSSPSKTPTRCSTPHSLDRSVNHRTPPTTSDTLSAGKRIPANTNTSETSRSTFVIDSHSRTLNSSTGSCLPEVPDVTADIFVNNNIFDLARKPVPAKPIGSTGMGHEERFGNRTNKRSALKTGERSKPSDSEKFSSSMKLSRSPVQSWRVLPKIDIASSILYHLLFWRLYHIVICFSYLQWQLLIKVIAVGYLFWTATKAVSRSGEKSRAVLAGSDTQRLNMKTVPDAKSIRQQSPQPRVTLRQGSLSLERNPQETRYLTTSNRPRSSNTAFIRDRNSAIVKPTPTTSRGSFNVTTRKPESSKYIKTLPPMNSRYSFNHSNKSFKPQLEDIKSSFLLMNNKNTGRNAKAQPERDNRQVQVFKPQPLNENERRKLLQKTISKFQTKQYWNDSKYDKIEGLNWIPWK